MAPSAKQAFKKLDNSLEKFCNGIYHCVFVQIAHVHSQILKAVIDVGSLLFQRINIDIEISASERVTPI